MARCSLDGAKAANCLQRESAPDEKTIQCPVAARAAGSLPELINQRGRGLIQIIERIQPTMIINPKHQYFSGLHELDFRRSHRRKLQLLFDHLVGARDHCWRYGNAQLFCGL
jgi:hypothetical protein